MRIDAVVAASPARRGDRHEISSPSISSSGSGCCCAPGFVASGKGASMAVAANTHHCRLPSRRRRLMGQWLSARLRQPFIMENRSGATGNIANHSFKGQ
jgi:hypothetical protein